MTVADILKKLNAAKHPEDVFGSLDGTTLAKVYRQLAKDLHPDKNPADAAMAAEAFVRLSVWKDRAKAKVRAGTYGNRRAAASATIITKKGKYSVVCSLNPGDMSDVYLATDASGAKVVVKILRNPANADLMANELNVLKYMHDEWSGKKLKIMHHVPEVLDSYRIKEGSVNRQALVFKYDDGITLEDVDQAYAAAVMYVDPRDLAWMINRMMAAIMACHQAGYVHCGVLPPHIYLHPVTHGGQLLDWSYAVKPGGALKAISPKYRSFYPPELLLADKAKRKPVTFGADLFMLAKCVWHMTEDGAKLPPAYAGLFRSCLLGPVHRPQDVFEVFEDFQKVLKALYGPKKFREFELPKPKAKT